MLASGSGTTSASSEDGLGKTLFSRMEKLGIKPIALNIQYRLHPLLSSIVNKLFYNNILLDGKKKDKEKGRGNEKEVNERRKKKRRR